MDTPKTQIQDQNPNASIGALIIQNGRLRGTRRELKVPTTFLGKSPRCDLRLNVDGINPLHCVIVWNDGQVFLRDLESVTGTFVNGNRVTECALRHGDELGIGPFQFAVFLEEVDEHVGSGRSVRGGKADLTAHYDAIRVQVAAVAAQQAALTEQELVLVQRRTTLDKQKSQLAGHLEQKRQRLVELQTQLQAARQELQQEKTTYEQFVQKTTADLSLSERELVENQQETAAERKRIGELQRKLKHRFHKRWFNERQSMTEREAELTRGYQQWKKEVDQFHDDKEKDAQEHRKILSDLEVSRKQLQTEWKDFHYHQKQARELLQNERDELQDAFESLDEREKRIRQAEESLEVERDTHASVMAGLKKESEGLENRIRNQRRKLFDQEQAVLHSKQLPEENRTPAKPGSSLVQFWESTTHSVSESGELVPRRSYPLAVIPPLEQRIEYWLFNTPRQQVDPEVEMKKQRLNRQLEMLEEMVDELSDQRLFLVAQWEDIFLARVHWLSEQNSVSAEMSEVTQRMCEKAQAVLEREQQLVHAEKTLKQRQESLQKTRHYLVGLQTKLRSREMGWQGERQHFITELRSRERMVEQQLHSVVELRKQWLSQRQTEVKDYQSAKSASEKAFQEYLALGEERRKQIRALDEERKTLTSKSLTLEQYRQQVLARSSDAPAAERRLERLARRWQVEHTDAELNAQRQIDELKNELAMLQARYEGLKAEMEMDRELHDKQLSENTQLDQQKLMIHNQHIQAQEQLQAVRTQRDQALQQVKEMQAAVERVARMMMEDPNVATIQMIRNELTNQTESRDENVDRAA